MRKIVHVNYIKNNALKPKWKLYDASEKYFYSIAIFFKKLLKFIFFETSWKADGMGSGENTWQGEKKFCAYLCKLNLKEIE